LITVLILGILVGLDNLQIASAIGLMGLKPSRRVFLISAFVFFEVSMPLVGLLVGNQLNMQFQTVAEWLGPSIMISLGVFIIVREIMNKEHHDFISNKWMLILLPFFMSLDNLLAGIGLGTSGYPIISTSIVVGICAGTMCLLGLLIGDKLRKLIPNKIELISGLYLILLAVFLIVN
jgi:putative Mn2+ efflux pump MntP